MRILASCDSAVVSLKNEANPSKLEGSRIQYWGERHEEVSLLTAAEGSSACFLDLP